MGFVVPVDGSALAETALARAAEFGGVLGERVITVSVIPEGNASCARERGWIGPDASFDLDEVVATLHEAVKGIDDAAESRGPNSDSHP